MVNVDRVSLSLSLSPRPRASLSPSLSLCLSSLALLACVLEAHDREYIIIERFLPTAGIKDDTRVFFLPLTIIIDWDRTGEIERLKGEGERGGRS